MSSCSKCGAPIKNLDSHNCDYCGALIKNKDGELIEETIFNSYQEFLDNFKEKIKKLEMQKGEITFNDDPDNDVIYEDENKKIAAEINNLYIPVEQKDITYLAQYLTSRISHSANETNHNYFESMEGNPVPGAWVAKAEELSSSIKFAEDNSETLRFADILDQQIEDGKAELKKIAEKQGAFNKKLMIGIFGAFVIIIFVILITT